MNERLCFFLVPAASNLEWFDFHIERSPLSIVWDEYLATKFRLQYRSDRLITFLFFCFVFVFSKRQLASLSIFSSRYLDRMLYIQRIFKSHLKCPIQSANSHPKSQYELISYYMNVLKNGSILLSITQRGWKLWNTSGYVNVYV